MTSKTYIGTIKFFNPKGSYGFLIVPDLDTEDLFFHIDKQVEFYDNGSEPVGTKRVHPRLPRVNPAEPERVFFQLVANGGRPRADPWGYADEWDDLWQQIECRRLGIPYSTDTQ